MTNKFFSKRFIFRSLSALFAFWLILTYSSHGLLVNADYEYEAAPDGTFSPSKASCFYFTGISIVNMQIITKPQQLIVLEGKGFINTDIRSILCPRTINFNAFTRGVVISPANQ